MNKFKVSIYFFHVSVGGSDLLIDEQHGFRSGRSCTTQLLEVLEQWSQTLNIWHSLDCVCLDYRKAFDSVPHIRLLQKVESYEISGQLFEWIKSYLSGRSQNGSSKWNGIHFCSNDKWNTPGQRTGSDIVHRLDE